MDALRNKRLEWIDIIRGIAIVAVVMGYLRYSSYNEGLKDTIYSFHMAMFFVLAGCTTHLSYKDEFVPFIKKKAVALVIPYTVWNFLVLPYSYNHGFLYENLMSRFEIFIFGRCNHGGFFWFLLTLFAYQLIFAIYAKMIEPRVKNFAFRVISLMLIYVPVIVLHRVYGENGEGFGLATQMYLFYIPFMVGVCLLRYKEVWNILFNKWSFCVFVLLALYVPGMYGDMNNLGHVARITGIGITCILVKMIQDGYFFNVQIRNALTVIGKNSLGIYIFHYLFVDMFAKNSAGVLGRMDPLAMFCLYLPISLVVALLCIGIVKIIEQSSIASIILLGKVKR